MLTDRQKLTIQHLAKRDITEPLKIVEWCAETLTHPQGKTLAKRLGVTRRRHSKKYLQEIINHIAQGGELPKAKRLETDG